jgi:hypothetical protein
MAITGIKNVDFLITATGEGVINANGAFAAYNPAAGKVIKNHLFPKLRGMDPMQRLSKQEGEEGGAMLVSLGDPAIGDAQMIVSAECIRAALFKAVSFGLIQVTVDNVGAVLASLHGLVRGYLITGPKCNFARKSPLFVTDFECAQPGLVFSQGTNSKVRGTEKEKTSMYSYFKTGKNLHYIGKATLAIEDLQFIPMENSLERSAFNQEISLEQGQTVAAGITAFLTDLARTGQVPVARFVKKAHRVGAVSWATEAGILLNDDALRVVIDQIKDLITHLYIRQGKGYLQVLEVLVDYNESNRVFRAETDRGIAVGVDGGHFAQYYNEVEISDALYKKAAADARQSRADFARKKAELAEKKAEDAALRAQAKAAH